MLPHTFWAWGGAWWRQLELGFSIGGVDVVGAKEHQSASAETVAERGKTQLVIVVVLSIDDHAVDVDTRVQHGHYTASCQLPQTHAAVRRAAGHKPVRRTDARAQHLYHTGRNCEHDV